ARSAPLPLAEAVDVVGRNHDLSALIWMRSLGGRLAVRLAEDGEYRLYAVTREGTTPMARNWPRLWHEGNFAGVWSSAMNVILSITMIGLLVTGVWAWLRRQFRRRARRLHQAAAA
ncbi:MAG: PepSY domain-containing protein, partial [Tepidamorphaceae bacterium]